MSRIASFSLAAPVFFALLTGCGSASTSQNTATTPSAAEATAPSTARAQDAASVNRGRNGIDPARNGAKGAKSDGSTIVKSDNDITETSTTMPRTFPREDVRTAVRAASSGLRSCNESGARKRLEVALRFEPSGKVSKVDVLSTGEDAAVVDCVKSRLAEISVTSFQGDATTVKVPVRF